MGKPATKPKQQTEAEAIAERFAAEYSYGETITRAVILDAFGVDMPDMMRSTEWQKKQLEILQVVADLKTAMLKDHQIALQTIPGKGWELVNPSHQTTFAMRGLKDSVKGSVRKTSSFLTHIRADELTANEIQENAEAVAKLAAFRAIAKKTI